MMSLEIIEAFVTQLFDMVATGDLSTYEAKKKYEAFSQDIMKYYEITKKKVSNKWKHY